MVSERAKKVTRHGAERVRERMGLPKGSVEKNVARALEFGITHAEAKGGLRRYLDDLYLRRGGFGDVRVYHRYVYIFKGGVLVTALYLPREFHKIEDAIMREKKDKLL